MNLSKMISSLDKELQGVIKRISRIAQKENQRAYLVGGFVRDILLHIKNFDVDIVVRDQGIKFAHILNKAFKWEITTHSRFGTAVIADKDFKIDISTSREESYPYPGSLPVVKWGSLVDDLARRDFTINAMAVSINKNDFGRVIDYFDGIKDLRLRQLKVLHEKSFLDDPTRILRLARFKSRFGFSIQGATRRLLNQAKSVKALEGVQKHRVRDELILIFKEREPEKALKDLQDLYGLQFIDKDLRFGAWHSRDFASIRKAFDWFEVNFPSRRPVELWFMYLIVLLSALEEHSIERIIADFAFKRGQLIRILSFKKYAYRALAKLDNPDLSPSEVYNILDPLSYEVILIIYSISGSQRVKRYIRDFFEFYNLATIKVSGHDLRKLGISPGPGFKEILKKVKEGKLNLKLSTKHQELSLAKKLIKK